MRPSEAVARLDAGKADFCTALIAAFSALPGVRSVTFPGSFTEKPGLSGISDIDAVVVVDSLTEETFAACCAAARRAEPSRLGLPHHQLRLNESFGPLKFDEPNVIVLHLMVYDLAGHRDHVLQSPFTCLDWERSPYHAGPTLRQLYPVIGLMPRHFAAARRSLKNYVEDISAGVISYRRHAFAPNGRTEVVARLPLDRRHQGEYAYHIARNLVANYAKLITGQNRAWPHAELRQFWHDHLPQCRSLISWFDDLATKKHTRATDFPEDTLSNTRRFLELFGMDFSAAWTVRAVRHGFIRHGRTAMNDGTFLGQRRDPGLLDVPTPLPHAPAQVFSSPAQRCRQTAAGLVPTAQPSIDSRLHEIDYGDAEGLDFSELDRLHPGVTAGWNRGEDPAFPGGENTAGVLARLESFLQDLPPRPTLSVTHNVVLRCLLGSLLHLPRSLWHRIPVEHLDELEVLELEGRFYPNLTAAQVTRLSDALAGHLS